MFELVVAKKTTIIESAIITADEGPRIKAFCNRSCLFATTSSNNFPSLTRSSDLSLQDKHQKPVWKSALTDIYPSSKSVEMFLYVAYAN